MGTTAVADRPDPQAAPGEVVVEVLACGLCGTDRHILRGEYPARLPLVLGHEFGGRIVESRADGWSVGDLVSVDPNVSCGTCDDCCAGRVALCPQRYAFGVDVDGGLAERCAVPAGQLAAMAADTPAHRLAFVEPLACCLRGRDLAGLTGGESVAVLGGGVIGQLMVQLAAAAGAQRITLVTRQRQRRELALGLGATDACTPNEADAHLTRTFDVVFECAGVLATFDQAQRLARRGGSVILLGIPPEQAEITVRPFALVCDELRIQGSFLNPLTQGRAADLISNGLIDVDQLTSRVIGLDEVGDELAGEPRSGAVKVVVDPRRNV